jgi:putative FmdB family regulatory protein
MPIYEYRCEKCGDFEQMQRITDPPIDRCPRCHRKVRRLISNTSFQLKGSGWYVTDYPRGGAKRDGDTAAKSETKSEAKAEKSESGKSSTTASEKTAS